MVKLCNLSFPYACYLSRVKFSVRTLCDLLFPENGVVVCARRAHCDILDFVRNSDLPMLLSDWFYQR